MKLNLFLLIASTLILPFTLASPLKTLQPRASVDQSCGRYSHLIDDALDNIHDMCSSALSAIDWIKNNYNRHSPDYWWNVHRARVMVPLRMMLAIDLNQGMTQENREALRKLKKIIRGVQHAVAHNVDLPIFCGDTWRQKGTNPQGTVSYWDPIWQVWDTEPTCEDSPSFAYVLHKHRGHPNTPERIVYCTDFLESALSKMTLAQYKSYPHYLFGVSIDIPRETPAGVAFHEMTHTRYAGTLRDVKCTIGSQRAPAYRFNGVTWLARTQPQDALDNADSVMLFALAMYLDQLYWADGYGVPLANVCL